MPCVQEVIERKPKSDANILLTQWRAVKGHDTPIDLHLLADELANRTNISALAIEYRDLGRTIDGAMAGLGDNKWGIAINRNVLSVGRRRFTLAHEIYHFYRHRDIQEHFRCSKNDIDSFFGKTLEDEANAFASQLLIPPDVVRQIDDEVFSYETVKKAANTLRVSVTAFAYAWVNLSNRRVGFFQSRDGFIDRGRASEKAYESGVFFRNGDELPENCLTTEVQMNRSSDQSLVDPRIWHRRIGCFEDVHTTIFEDYTYTFLDFEKSP